MKNLNVRHVRWIFHSFEKQFLILFGVVALTLLFAAMAFSRTPYENEDFHDQSPVFRLKLFPKRTKGREAFYFSKALEYYVQKKSPLAREKFDQLLKEFPKTKFKEPATFLRIDTEFFMAVKRKSPDYKKIIREYEAAIDKYPTSKFVPWATFQIANCYKYMNYTYEAIAQYAILIENYSTGPHIESALFYSAKMRYEAADYKNSIKLLKNFEKSFPKSKYLIMANFILGDSYYNLDEMKEAFKHFARTKGIAKYDPKITQYFAELLYNFKDYKRAIHILTTIINYYPKYRNIKRTYELLADCFLQLKDYRNAVNSYFRVTKNYPKSKEAVRSRLKIAEIGAKLGPKKYSIINKSSDINFVLDMKSVYTKAYLENKDNKYGQLSLFELGNIAVKQGNDLRGLQLYKKLNDDYPLGTYFDTSLTNIIELLNKIVAQRYRAAEYLKVVSMYKEYDEEIKSAYSSDVAGVLYYVGRSLVELKLFSPALELFEKIRNENPEYKDEELTYLSALSAFGAQRFELAEKYSDEHLGRFHKSRFREEVDTIKAKSVFKLARYDEAITLLKKATTSKHNKSSPLSLVEIYSDIAKSYSNQSQEGRAIDYYKEALRIAKKRRGESVFAKIYNDTLLSLASLSFVSKNYLNSTMYYEKSLTEKIKNKSLKTGDNTHLFYLAKSYQARADLESAKRYYNILLKNSTQGFYARSAKEELVQVELRQKLKASKK